MAGLVISTLAIAAAEQTPAPTDLVEPVDLEGDVTDVAWWVDLATGPVLRTVAILAVAVVARFVLTRVIRGLVKGLSKAAETDLSKAGVTETARESLGTNSIDVQRRQTRATTLGRLLTNVGSVVIWAIAALMILGEWGFNLAPLVAGAGIVGIALGFGAQTLVADFLSGVFMLLEDQYGVGDVVDMGEASGVVEDVGLRVTRLRAVDGVVWYVRNGEVVRVGNMSQNWSRALLDIGVAYTSDLPRVRQLLEEEAHKLNQDEEWGALLLEDPEVWGVENLGPDSIVIRLVLKTLPGEQWAVARELRQRIKARFDAEGVEIPFPQRTVWVRNT
jgi:small conductance mechanosensitive channel